MKTPGRRHRPDAATAGPAVEQLEVIFKALADRTRLRILALLAAGETCVCDIHASLGLAQPKVSRHLAYLRRVGLVETRRDGQWVHYRLAQTASPVLSMLVASVAHSLDHVPSTAADRASLQKATGCCVRIAPLSDVAFPCCARREK